MHETCCNLVKPYCDALFTLENFINSYMTTKKRPKNTAYAVFLSLYSVFHIRRRVFGPQVYLIASERLVGQACFVCRISQMTVTVSLLLMSSGSRSIIGALS